MCIAVKISLNKIYAELLRRGATFGGLSGIRNETVGSVAGLLCDRELLLFLE